MKTKAIEQYFRKNWLSNLIFLAVLANVASMIWAALAHRHLFSGYFTYWSLLDNQEIFTDSRFQRWFSVLLQMPTLLYLKFAHSPSIPLATLLFDMMNSIHPLISLLLSYRILLKAGKKELFIFPLLSFALGTQAIMPLSALTIPETLSLFWPLILWLRFRDETTVKASVIMSILILAFAFTHEHAIIFYPLLALAFYLGLSQQPKLSNIFVGSSIAMSLAIMVFRLQAPSDPSMPPIWSYGTSITPESYLLVSITTIGAMVIASLGANFLKDKFAKPLSIVSGLVGVGLTIYFLHSSFDPNLNLRYLVSSWFASTTVIPLVAVIAALFLFSARKNYFEWLIGSPHFKGLSFLTLTALIMACTHDVFATTGWSSVYSFSKQLQMDFPGCNVIDPESHAKLYEGKLARDPSWTSLLSVHPEDGYQIDSLIMIENPATGAACNPDSKEDEQQRSLNMVSMHASALNYKFKKLTEKPAHILKWDDEQKKVIATSVETAKKEKK